MKLYELKKGSKIYCETSDGGEYIIFDHIDGMYSYCTTEKGAVVHLWSATELEKKDDGYQLI